jgi:hypothetical protein
MNLLTCLISILNLWRPVFCKQEAFERAKEHAFASLCAFGRKVITNFAILLGRDHEDITADYKLYSERKWNPREIFDIILNQALLFLDDEDPYIRSAADDTSVRKTGKKIPQARYMRDAMGPKFHTNLIWGIRYLQFSLTYRQDIGAARGIPIRFIDAPSIKKPGKKATEEEWKEYKQAIKTHNLSHTFVSEVKNLRESLDKMGYSHKILLKVCDASFCNKTCFQMEVERTQIIARCRKNIKLCFPAKTGERRFYDEKKFTPEEIRKDESIPWQTTYRFYGGELRAIKYKEVNEVLWQNGTRRKKLRCIVIAPLPYVRGGKKNYRDPGFLLTTDITGPIELLIQAYLDRLQIEYNFRDEKDVLGVGEAQVRNENSVAKQPALHVAAYSALLLANLIVYKDLHHEDFGPVPHWRQTPKRNTCRALVGVLRKQLLDHPEKIVELGLTPPIISAILCKAA